MLRIFSRSWMIVPATIVNLLLAGKSYSSEKVVVGRTWPADQRVAIDRVDHSAYNALLRKYVDDRGMVDYTAWKASARDSAALDSYLAALSMADTGQRASRAAVLAYWINAYNALTIKGILREYPTTSIRNHTAKLVGYNIWDDLLVVVGDSKYSLNDIEHKILRKMDDPRIHFAIVCASIGCPKLLSEAFIASKLDAQLTANSQAFFADSGKFQADIRRGRIALSPILKWFGEDFGRSTAEQLARIAPYLPTREAQQLAKSGRARVSYLDYDWGLNDRKPAR